MVLTTDELASGRCPVCGSSFSKSELIHKPDPWGGGIDREYDTYEDEEDYRNERDYRRDIRRTSPEMEKARRQTATVLFVLAGLQMLCGVLLFSLAPQLESQLGSQIPQEDLLISVATVAGAGIVFLL